MAAWDLNRRKPMHRALDKAKEIMQLQPGANGWAINFDASISTKGGLPAKDNREVRRLARSRLKRINLRLQR